MKCEKVKGGEIWLRFESVEVFSKSKQALKDILKRYDAPDDRLNTYEVNVLIWNEMKRSGWCPRCQAGAIDELRDAFGEENVKLVNERTVNIYNRKFKDSENIERIANYLERVMECLERIADSCSYPELQQFDNLKQNVQ